MGHRIRNWSAAGVIFLGLGSAGWLFYNNSRLTMPAATRAAEQHPAPSAAETIRSSPPAADPAEALASGKKTAPNPEAAIPLPEGEALEYTAHVANLNNVAALRLLIGERRNFLGRTAWHLQAFAHTQNPLRMVFALDDQFDSYSDAATLISLQYELHLNERGQKVDSVLRMTTGKEPAPPDATAARVLPGTRDPLGMIQFLRTVNWSRTPEVRSPVFDGHKLYEVRARLVSSAENVSVPAGEFSATKIDLQVFDGGVEAKDTHFSVHFANTPARTPVLLEAVLPVASARVELLRTQ
jgi:hypothetical protein